MKTDIKKVALVTGASSGIGLDVSLKLLDEGFIVYGAARRTELMKPILEKGGKAVFLDLCDLTSIKNCVEQILSEEGRIDLLVNDAGFGVGGTIEDVPVSEARRLFDVNVFGLSQITQLVLPSMRKQRSGKIINISSMAGRFSSAFSGWYHASKYCVEALSDALRQETAPFGIKVVIIEPGMIQTDWGKIHAESMRKFSGKTAYQKNAECAAEFYEKYYENCEKLPKPEIITKLILKAVRTKNPKARYHAGKFAGMFIFAKGIFSDRILDKLTEISLNIK